ncbi:MAG TPA: hypothetical protein VGH81_08210 [Rudaea sp.]|jgi:hypothetical protein
MIEEARAASHRRRSGKAVTMRTGKMPVWAFNGTQERGNRCRGIFPRSDYCLVDRR